MTSTVVVYDYDYYFRTFYWSSTLPPPPPPQTQPGWTPPGVPVAVQIMAANTKATKAAHQQAIDHLEDAAQNKTPCKEIMDLLMKGVQDGMAGFMKSLGGLQLVDGSNSTVTFASLNQTPPVPGLKTIGDLLKLPGIIAYTPKTGNTVYYSPWYWSLNAGTVVHENFHKHFYDDTQLSNFLTPFYQKDHGGASPPKGSQWISDLIQTRCF